MLSFSEEFCLILIRSFPVSFVFWGHLGGVPPPHFGYLLELTFQNCKKIIHFYFAYGFSIFHAQLFRGIFAHSNSFISGVFYVLRTSRRVPSTPYELLSKKNVIWSIVFFLKMWAKLFIVLKSPMWMQKWWEDLYENLDFQLENFWTTLPHPSSYR